MYIALPHFKLNKFLHLCNHLYYAQCTLSSIGIILDTIDTDSQTTRYHTEMKITAIAHH